MDQRTENKDILNQTGTDPYICDVCIKILKHLRSIPSYDQLAIGTHSLGELKSNSYCTIHPELLRGFFPDKSRTTCQVASKNYEPGLCISFDKYFSGNFYFNLVKHAEGEGNVGHGRINDASWIDPALLRGWKEACCATHGPNCGQTLASSRLPASHALWLIDTHKYCLVPAQAGYEYVALSYIWGTKAMLMTLLSNLSDLQNEQALSTGPLVDQVPRTIRDSIELVKLLGERYLWADALCIVQDDGAAKLKQINNMTSIYAAAKLTIISAQATDSRHGLRGLENISEPRSLQPRTVSAGGHRFVERLTYTPGILPWCRRGWTFQEALFSPRRLIFSDDSVQWSCGSVAWTEDLEYDLKPRLLGSGWGIIGGETLDFAFPDIVGLNQLVETYGARQFTFPEDTLSAFAGLSTAISHIFLGGFIQGLPVMFLDAALVWRPNSHTQWPEPGSVNHIYRKTPLKAQGECPPTWSWAGWATAADYSSWMGASDYVRYSKAMDIWPADFRTEPLVEWYARDEKESEPKRIPYQNEWFTYRQRFLNKGEGELPTGWTRCDIKSLKAQDDGHFRAWQPEEQTPSFYYVHDDIPDTEFWYPIPAIKSSQTSNDFQWGRYLSCRTQKGLFWTEPSDKALRGLRDPRIEAWVDDYPAALPGKLENAPTPIPLQDESGSFAGCLIMHAAASPLTVHKKDGDGAAGSRSQGHRQLKRPVPNTKNSSLTQRPRRKGKPFQLVAISKGHSFSSFEDDYDFANVLWVGWIDGIAYRKGLGRVFRDVWERQQLENIELVLG